MTRLHDLAAAGTSPWLDNIRRSWLESGVFRRKVDDGIVGVTSNPTIFQKAIADSSDYDEAIRATRGESAQDVFFELAIKDVQDAADQLKDVYDGTGHLDGFVSFELPPGLANDEAGSIAAAPDFWKRIARPNIFIKIPGTAEGVKAIEESIAAGVNVNVTLLFSLERYDEIHWAFIRGLERRVEAGEPIDDIHSVASFFVSRVDTAVDKQLGDGSPLARQGRRGERQDGVPAVPRDHGERPVEGARGRRRAGAAAAVGVHRHQEPGVLGRALRRDADRAPSA